ncbi:MAG: hypothetical protein H0T79_03400 [Deltaproteobacteria bacterium]|nr:hypothetical protein [Deltaproteobacteria bacterium]
MKPYLLLAMSLIGCATAAKEDGNANPDGGLQRPDGSTSSIDGAPSTLDAFVPVDAPPGVQEKTLTQTTNTTMTPEASIACNDGVSTSENSWYRVFRLSDSQIASAFQPTRVTFQVDWAAAGAGGMQPVQVSVGSYTGTVDATTIDLTKVTNLGSAIAMVPDGDATVAIPPAMEVPITSGPVPASGNLIVEVRAPDGIPAGNIFFLGVSTGGESHPGYLRATTAACDFVTPTSLVSKGHAIHALIQVTGTY